MSNYFEDAVHITRTLKEKLPVPVIWGGIHPTVRPDESLERADMICVGEAEECLPEFLRRMARGQTYEGVPNLWIRSGARIIRNDVRMVENLDAIPFQDWDAQDHYVLEGQHICRMSDDVIARLHKRLANVHVDVPSVYMTMPSRGCPFACTSCVNSALKRVYSGQKAVRHRSVGNVIAELMEARRRRPSLKGIRFEDDCFFSRTADDITAFARAYKSEVGLPLYITGSTPTTLTREKLSPLVDAGLNEIRMGIQTGSERAKRLYNRHHSNAQVERAAMLLNEFKDRIRPPQYDVIIDNPWETEEDLVETLQLLARLPKPYALSLYALTFYPGTELYDRARAEGIVTDDVRDSYNGDIRTLASTPATEAFKKMAVLAREGREIDPASISVNILLPQRPEPAGPFGGRAAAGEASAGALADVVVAASPALQCEHGPRAAGPC